MLLAFNKPFGVISQFTPDGSPHRTLAEFGFPKGVYPIGRLDAESEGLLLLSDEAALNERLLHPDHGHRRTYWAQVERMPAREALDKMESGLDDQRRRTRMPRMATLLDPQPEIPRTKASGPFPQEMCRILDRIGIDRGKKSPGPARHDGGRSAIRHCA